MRCHLLGLSHTQTTREYSACAFTQKIRLLARMLHERGHHVIHYGVAGSDPQCSENVVTVPMEIFDKTHRAKSWHSGFNLNPRELTNVLHLEHCIEEVGRRKQPGDFLLCPFGYAHKEIADAHADMIVVESGIGYGATFAPHKIFESYSWMHFCYGRTLYNEQPPWTDAVIPNYLDLADYPFRPVKADPPYAIHVARPTTMKGRAIAAAACKAAGIPLFVAGQGHGRSEDWIDLGVLSIEQRARWVGGATCLIQPTLYIEPFGTCTIEAAAYGTPVITTDWGAFTETVLHGVTGYRCRTPEEFSWAVAHAGDLSPIDCRRVAEQRYSLDKVGAMYERYFETLAAHVAGTPLPVTDLDTLMRERL